LVLSTKRLVAAAKVSVAATIFFVDPNFVAVTKPFFSVHAVSFQCVSFRRFKPSGAVTNNSKVNKKAKRHFNLKHLRQALCRLLLGGSYCLYATQRDRQEDESRSDAQGM